MADQKIGIKVTAKDGASKVLTGIGGKVIALNQGLQLLSTVTSAVSGAFASVVKEGSDFEKQMSAVKAVSTTTTKDFKRLNDEAKRIGATTEFSATQAGSAMEELRRAGLSTTKTLETTADAMLLASASGSEFSTVARFTAVSMSVFAGQGLKASQVADDMNQSLASAPQNFEELSKAVEI